MDNAKHNQHAISKWRAILAYILPIAGPLYLIVSKRDNAYVQYHARQMLALTIVAVMLPLVWGIVAWLLSWIPIVGPLLAAALFALVILGFIFAAGVWIVGVIQVIRGQLQPLPIVGELSERWFTASGIG